jgi:hypothetical protein
MNSQTFVNPSIGLLVGRALASAMAFASRIGRSTWDWLGVLGRERARSELLRMAESHAATQPALAAQLRAAAQRNWFGED